MAYGAGRTNFICHNVQRPGRRGDGFDKPTDFELYGPRLAQRETRNCRAKDFGVRVPVYALAELVLVDYALVLFNARELRAKDFKRRVEEGRERGCGCYTPPAVVVRIPVVLNPSSLPAVNRGPRLRIDTLNELVQLLGGKRGIRQ